MNKIKTYGCGLAIVLAVTLAVGCEQTSQSANSASANATPTVQTPPQTPPQNPEDRMPRVRAEEAIRLFKAGEAVIIDVRGTQAYNVSHTKGAIDFPLDRLETGDVTGLPRDKRIIAYCT
jgi:hypothetical protein